MAGDPADVFRVYGDTSAASPNLASDTGVRRGTVPPVHDEPEWRPEPWTAGRVVARFGDLRRSGAAVERYLGEHHAYDLMHNVSLSDEAVAQLLSGSTVSGTLHSRTLTRGQRRDFLAAVPRREWEVAGTRSGPGSRTGSGASAAPTNCSTCSAQTGTVPTASWWPLSLY